MLKLGIVEAESNNSIFDDWLDDHFSTWSWDVPHLACIREQLHKITDGTCRRLMLFLPPRHGKSEMVTVRYSAWMLERDPSRRVIIGAYNQTLANKFSRKVRKIARQHIALSKERTAVDDWETEAGGGLRAVGVGAGVTGMGGDLIVIDDPVKNREEASSPTYRAKVWEWFTDDLYTRQEPGGSIVLIMTRWHEDDLAGRILNSESAGDWTVVSLPALAMDDDPIGREKGEALWPERYDLAALMDYKTVLGRSFHALYQQAPQEQEGDLFKRSNFQYIDASDVTDGTDWVWYWDKAATSGGGDYSAGVKMGRTTDGRYIIADVRQGQWSTDERDRLCTSIMRAEGAGVATHFEREGGSSGKDVETYQARVFAGYPVFFEHVTGSKEVRAMPFAAQVEAKNVYLVRALWNNSYIDELTVFPNGLNDDQVDGSSGAFAKVAQSFYFWDPNEDDDW